MGSVVAISFVSVVSKFGSQMQDLAATLFIPGMLLLLYILLKPSRQRSYIQDYQFDSHLKDRVALKHPSLTPKQIDRVFNGLKDYFYIYAARPEPKWSPCRRKWSTMPGTMGAFRKSTSCRSVGIRP